MKMTDKEKLEYIYKLISAIRMMNKCAPLTYSEKIHRLSTCAMDVAMCDDSYIEDNIDKLVDALREANLVLDQRG